MNAVSQHTDDAAAYLVAQWRSNADAANPAGPLFAGGEFAEADIVADTSPISGRCGTACSGSRTRQCC